MVIFSVPHGETFLPDFMRSFNSRLLSVSVRRPTLDDVFIKLTGRAIRENEVDLRDQMRNMMRGHG
jgi:ABC-2 type transport system ATP-binding protein